MYGLETLGNSIWYPLKSFGIGLLEFIPQLLAAIIVLVFGYFLGVFLEKGIHKLMSWLKIDKEFSIEDYHGFTANMSLEKTVSAIAKWYVFIIFVQAALPLLNLGALNDFANQFVLWLPNLVAGIVIVLFGLYASDFLGKELSKVRNKIRSKLAELGRYLLAFIFILVGLEQIGIKVAVVQQTWLIMFAGLALAFGLAIGLGFGLGMKDYAKELIEELQLKYKHNHSHAEDEN